MAEEGLGLGEGDVTVPGGIIIGEEEGDIIGEEEGDIIGEEEGDIFEGEGDIIGEEEGDIIDGEGADAGAPPCTIINWPRMTPAGFPVVCTFT